MAEAEVFPGIGLGGFGSFPGEIQFVAPLEKISVLIGPNNVGKSTTLAFFFEYLQAALHGARREAAFSVGPDYIRRVDGEPPTRLRFALPIDPGRLEGTADPLLTRAMAALEIRGLPKQWIPFSLPPEGGTPEVDESVTYEIAGVLTEPDWANLAGRITGSAGDTPSNVLRILNELKRRVLINVPDIVSIPPHRQITQDAGTDLNPAEKTFGGVGLVRHLDRLRNPEVEEKDASAAKRSEFIDAVQTILEVSSFDYNVSQGRRNLLLEIDGQTRLRTSHGTGYEHIVLLVAATVLFPNAFICVEEPEVHMHPRLQRRLAEYLHTRSNQLLISTHSATLIDALQAATFRLELKDHGTRVSPPVKQASLAALDELGYRASDLLQTNCVIWVEGPSDRIYLKWWLSRNAPHLTEGIHFTVMFYGGALVANVTAAEEPSLDNEALVPLRRLNQRFILMADSDKQRYDDGLKPRVQRILDETSPDDEHAIIWVTDGRCIENYIQRPTLEAAIRRVHPTVETITPPRDRWDDPLLAFNEANSQIRVDKIAVAREVALSDSTSDSPDVVPTELDRVVSLIESANS